MCDKETSGTEWEPGEYYQFLTTLISIYVSGRAELWRSRNRNEIWGDVV